MRASRRSLPNGLSVDNSVQNRQSVLIWCREGSTVLLVVLARLALIRGGGGVFEFPPPAVGDLTVGLPSPLGVATGR